MPTSALGAGMAAARNLASSGGDAARISADWVPVLAEVPLFRDLSRRHLRRVAQLARLRRLPAMTRIVRAGDPGNAFYVIIDGRAKVFPPSGRPVMLRAGDSFGEMSLLDGAPRSADVTAEENVLVLSISTASFAKLLRSEPQISLALLRILAARLRAASSARSD